MSRPGLLNEEQQRDLVQIDKAQAGGYVWLFKQSASDIRERIEHLQPPGVSSDMDVDTVP